MKTYQKLLIGAAALAPLAFGGHRLYKSGFESGLEKGIEQGRTQMKDAVTHDFRDRSGSLRRQISLNRDFTLNPSESEISELEAREEELFDMWAHLYRCDEDFYVTWHSR